MAPTTIRDVAKQAGVGVGTVSRVLNDNPSVRESTRQTVLQAITELNYLPNPLARRLALGNTLTIASSSLSSLTLPSSGGCGASNTPWPAVSMT